MAKLLVRKTNTSLVLLFYSILLRYDDYLLFPQYENKHFSPREERDHSVYIPYTNDHLCFVSKILYSKMFFFGDHGLVVRELVVDLI